MPTRFLKQLVQLVRGARQVGLPPDRALGLALRCALDSIPPGRLQVCLDLLAHGRSKAGHVAARLGEPPATTARLLGALTALRVAHRDIVPEPSPFKGRDMDVSYYALRSEHTDLIDEISKLLGTRFVGGGREGEVKEDISSAGTLRAEEAPPEGLFAGTNFSGAEADPADDYPKDWDRV
jgi:IclR helix-turn-helix domain